MVDLSGESFKVFFLAHTNLECGVQEATNHNAAAPNYSKVTRPKRVAYGSLVKGSSLISSKSRLVKFCNLPRYRNSHDIFRILYTVFTYIQDHSVMLSLFKYNIHRYCNYQLCVSEEGTS